MKPDRRFKRLGIGVVVVVVLLGYASDILSRLAVGKIPRDPDVRPAVTLLAELKVEGEHDLNQYNRQRFGDGWSSGSGGCDTRTQVLIDEAKTPPTMADCELTGGQWHSPYDAVTVTDPGALDIDHVVPLAEAWASGAHYWSDRQRKAFANDTDRTDALIAVTAESNRAKGDRDPAEWMPPDRSVWCRYTKAWIAQKTAWNLTTDPAELQALRTALTTCPTEPATLEAQP